MVEFLWCTLDHVVTTLAGVSPETLQTTSQIVAALKELALDVI